MHLGLSEVGPYIWTATVFWESVIWQPTEATAIVFYMLTVMRASLFCCLFCASAPHLQLLGLQSVSCNLQMKLYLWSLMCYLLKVSLANVFEESCCYTIALFFFFFVSLGEDNQADGKLVCWHPGWSSWVTVPALLNVTGLLRGWL